MKIKRAYLFLVIVLVAFSCKDDYEASFDYHLFLENKAKWESHNIKDYAFEYRRGYFGNYDCYVIVKDGEFSEVYPAINKAILDNMADQEQIDAYKRSLYKHADTVDDIFNQIEKKFRNPIVEKDGNMVWYCSEINVTYDPVYGYPVTINFVHSGKNIEISDTNRSGTIKNFQTERPYVFNDSLY